jgi:hypothetical protein
MKGQWPNTNHPNKTENTCPKDMMRNLTAATPCGQKAFTSSAVIVVLPGSTRA